MHPSGRRLIVHTRNNKLQLLDLRVLVLLAFVLLLQPYSYLCKMCRFQMHL